jgi:hypothetical protein
MDTDILVETRLEDGRRLISLLASEQFDVRVAFWVKTSEDAAWQLWIASPSVNPNNKSEAIGKVYQLLDRVPGGGITPSDITLIEDDHPVARAAIEIRDRYQSREPLTFRRIRLGKVSAEEVAIYPRVLPWKVRQGSDGRWQVLISERDEVWLTCDSEEDARAIARAPVLQYEAMERTKTGESFAAELERTANVWEKYRMDFGSRFLRRHAQRVQSAQ